MIKIIYSHIYFLYRCIIYYYNIFKYSLHSKGKSISFSYLVYKINFLKDFQMQVLSIENILLKRFIYITKFHYDSIFKITLNCSIRKIEKSFFWKFLNQKIAQIKKSKIKDKLSNLMKFLFADYFREKKIFHLNSSSSLQLLIILNWNFLICELRKFRNFIKT